MTCEGCANGLRAKLFKLPDVASVEVDYPTKTAVVSFRASATHAPEDVIEAVEAVGSHATLAKTR